MRSTTRWCTAVPALGLAACAVAAGQPDTGAHGLLDASDVADAATTPDATTPDAALDAIVPPADVPTATDVADASDARTDARADVATDASRAPVTVRFQDGVSPTIAYRGTVDAYLSAAAVTTNYGMSTEVVVDGDVPVGSATARVALIGWNVATIPAGSVVQAASVTFTVGTTSNAGTVDAFPVYGVLRTWSEGIATWNYPSGSVAWTVPGAGGAGTDRTVASVGTVGPVASGATTAALNAAGVALVQSWVDDATHNAGIALASATMGDGLALISHEGTPAADRPRLTVTYLPP